MARLAGPQAVADLCRAFGLEPSRTRRIVLTLAVDEAVTIEVEQYVDRDAMGNFTTIVRRFELAEKAMDDIGLA